MPRAELQAACWASQLFPSARAVKSDASSVVNGVAKVAEFEQDGMAPPGLLQHSNGDLWHSWLLSRSSSLPEVVKLKAHLPVSWAARGSITFFDYAGNAAADALACSVTSLAQVPEGTRTLAQRCLALQTAVATRLSVIEGIVRRLQLAKDRDSCTDEVKIAAPTSTEEWARQFIGAVADHGHTPVRVGEAFRCSRCGTSASSLSAFMRWPCNQDDPTPNVRTTGCFDSSSQAPAAVAWGLNHRLVCISQGSYKSIICSAAGSLDDMWTFQCDKVDNSTISGGRAGLQAKFEQKSQIKEAKATSSRKSTNAAHRAASLVAAAVPVAPAEALAASCAHAPGPPPWLVSSFMYVVPEGTELRTARWLSHQDHEAAGSDLCAGACPLASRLGPMGAVQSCAHT